MTASELGLVVTKQAIHTSAPARLRQRIAEETRGAAKLEHLAEIANDNPRLRLMLIDRAIECFRRAVTLYAALV